MIWSYPWILHCVGTLYGQMAEVYLLNRTCLCMICVSVCVVSFLSIVQQFVEPRQLPPEYADYQDHNSPPMLRVPCLEDRTMAVQTFSYCVYDFLSEQELGTGGSPDTDKTDSFHEQSRRAKLNVFAPDSQDVRELWVVRPHVILVKVIYVCGFHVFFHQYVADIRERKSENIFRTVSTSPFVFNMTVMSSSGVIVSPSDVPVGQIQPLTSVVRSTDADSMVTPFVVPPPPDIERPVMKLDDFLTHRTPESCLSSLLISLSASSSALTLPRNPAKFSSSSFSLDRLQPLRGKISPPTGEALLPPPADDCLIPCLDDPNTAVRCETFPGSEYPFSLPACTTVRAVLSAPSDASDWAGYQDLYDAV